MKWCAYRKRKDGFMWRCRRSVVCFGSKSIKHGSWFQHTNLIFQEVMFLTYNIVHRVSACRIKREHRFSDNTLADWGVLQRPYSCTWRAALRRSAVLTKPFRSTKASSVSANTAGATLLRGKKEQMYCVME